MTTYISILGYHLQANESDTVLQARARGAVALMDGEATRYGSTANAPPSFRLFIGTGASSTPPPHSKLECQVALETLQRVAAGWPTPLAPSVHAAIATATSLPDTMNTRQEVQAAVRIATTDIAAAPPAFAPRYVIVTSGFHAPRALRDAAVVLDELVADATDAATSSAAKALRSGLSAAPTPDDPPIAPVRDVVIVEPPHRGDDPSVGSPLSLHLVLPGIFRVPADRRAALTADLAALIDRYSSTPQSDQ